MSRNKTHTRTNPTPASSEGPDHVDASTPSVHLDHRRNEVQTEEPAPAAPKTQDEQGSDVNRQPFDVNMPTVPGQTAEQTAAMPPQEDDGLRSLSLDEVTKLRDALVHVAGYQSGSSYRHDFNSGLEVLRTFGLTYDVHKADDRAIKVQNEVAANEASGAGSDE